MNNHEPTAAELAEAQERVAEDLRRLQARRAHVYEESAQQPQIPVETMEDVRERIVAAVAEQVVRDLAPQIESAVQRVWHQKMAQIKAATNAKETTTAGARKPPRLVGE